MEKKGRGFVEPKEKGTVHLMGFAALTKWYVTMKFPA